MHGRIEDRPAGVPIDTHALVPARRDDEVLASVAVEVARQEATAPRPHRVEDDRDERVQVAVVAVEEEPGAAVGSEEVRVSVALDVRRYERGQAAVDAKRRSEGAAAQVLDVGRTVEEAERRQQQVEVAIAVHVAQFEETLVGSSPGARDDPRRSQRTARGLGEEEGVDAGPAE